MIIGYLDCSFRKNNEGVSFGLRCDQILPFGGISAVDQKDKTLNSGKQHKGSRNSSSWKNRVRTTVTVGMERQDEAGGHREAHC